MSILSASILSLSISFIMICLLWSLEIYMYRRWEKYDKDAYEKAVKEREQAELEKLKSIIREVINETR